MAKLSSTGSVTFDDSVTIDVDTIDERKSSDPSCDVELSKIASATRDDGSVESMLMPVRIISTDAPHVGLYFTHWYGGMRALLLHPAGVVFLVLVALTMPFFSAWGKQGASYGQRMKMPRTGCSYCCARCPG